MSFEVYGTTSHQLIVSIQNNQVEYLAPGFSKPLEKILSDACFPFHMPGERERVFGTAREIHRGDPLYPRALQMYFEVQLQSHPETYTRNGSGEPGAFNSRGIKV